MFETLTKGFRAAKQKFQGLAELDEATVDEALKDVRTALLEADVGFEVVSGLLPAASGRRRSASSSR